MLGKKGAPSLFKFGFKVVPLEEAVARPSARLAVQREQRVLEFGLAACYANQCWRGRASGLIRRGRA